MVHIPFDTREVKFEDYVLQVGGGLIPTENHEIAEDPYTYFRGTNFQRGYGLGRQNGGGIGDILRGVWRFLLPIVRKAGTSLGKEALSTGERILDKIAEGENVKESVITEGKKGLDTIIEKGRDVLESGRKQFGGGPIKRQRKKDITPFHQTIVGRIVKKPPSKRKRIDTFGLF
jgi:hypothetical protein